MGALFLFGAGVLVGVFVIAIVMVLVEEKS